MSGIARRLMGVTKGGGGGGGLVFVGGATAISPTATQTPSFGLTGLTGGTDSSPSAGDIVVACVSFKDGTNRTIISTTSGYTKVADLYVNNQNDSQLGVFFKVLSSSETTVEFFVNTSLIFLFAVHVWRGVNQTTPLDATTTTTTGTGTARPDAPPITTVTPGAVVIAIGANAGSTFPSVLGSLTAPSGMEHFYQRTSGTLAGIGLASVHPPAVGVYDPPTFGGGSTSSFNSFCAATLALRPE